MNRAAFYKHLDTGHWLDLDDAGENYILRETKPKYAFREYRAGDGVYTLVLRGQRLTPASSGAVMAQPDNRKEAFIKIEEAPTLYAMSGDMSYPDEVTEGMECELKLSFAVDTSGSMSGNGMDELKLAIQSLVGAAPADKWQVSLDVFTDTADTPFGPGVIHNRGGSNSPLARFRQEVDAIQTGGGTAVVAGMLMADHSLTNDESSYQPIDERPRIAVLVSDGGFGEPDNEILEVAEMLRNDNNITILTVGMGLTGGDRTIMENIASRRNGQPLYFDVDVNQDVDSLHEAFMGVAAEFCGPVILQTSMDETVTASAGSTTGTWRVKMNPLWQYGPVDVRVGAFAMGQNNGASVNWATVTGAGLYDVLTLAPGDAPIERKFVVNVSESHISQSFGDSMVSFTLDRRYEDGNGGNYFEHLGSAREFATSYPFEMATNINWLNPMPDETGLGLTGAVYDSATKTMHVRIELTTNNEFADGTMVPVTVSAGVEQFELTSGTQYQWKPQHDWVPKSVFTPLNGVAGEQVHVAEVALEFVGDDAAFTGEGLEFRHRLNLTFNAAGKTNNWTGNFNTAAEDSVEFVLY